MRCERMDEIMKKMEKSGIKSLSDREIIELLFLKSTRSKDVSLACDKLFWYAKNMYQVSRATYEYFISFPGMSEQMAILLSVQNEIFFQALFDEGQKEIAKMGKIYIDEKERVKRLVELNLRGFLKERMLLILAYKNKRIFFCEPIGFGDYDFVKFNTLEVLRIADTKRAKFVILAHNHPSNIPEPSTSDLIITEDVRDALMFLDIYLVDHYIYCDDKCVSMADMGVRFSDIKKGNHIEKEFAQFEEYLKREYPKLKLFKNKEDHEKGK